MVNMGIHGVPALVAGGDGGTSGSVFFVPEEDWARAGAEIVAAPRAQRPTHSMRVRFFRMVKG